MDGVIDPPSSAHRLTPEVAASAKALRGSLAFWRGPATAIVGCAFIAEQSDHFYLGKLAVLPAHQGRGIGRRLLEAAERHAVSAGKPLIELQTRVELTANHRAFRALGFVEIGRTAHEGYDRPTSVTMRKRLAVSLDAHRRGAGDRLRRDGEGAAMAMRIVAESARLLGAPRLIPIASAHIDGALYHGDSGTLFAERLVEGGARVAVRSTLNVGALDLTGCSRVRLEEPMRGMARRMMEAYRKLGCEQSWTCAPYQAGHRPALRQRRRLGRIQRRRVLQFGARRAHQPLWRFPRHRLRDRRPRAGLRPASAGEPPGNADLRRRRTCRRRSSAPSIAWPVLGSLYGREVGNAVGVVTGVDRHPGEDALKAFGAAAASSGAVGLFHIAGVTPEAPDRRNGARRACPPKRRSR